MPSTVLEYEPPPAALRRTMVLVGWGIFVSTLAQTVTIGSLPLKVMLKDKLGVTPTQMALFFQLANLAWYFKPVAGLLSDSFPLFGTRRRQYLILGCIASAIGWFDRCSTDDARRTIDVTLSLVIKLNAKDQKTLSSDRNVPEAVRAFARREVARRET